MRRGSEVETVVGGSSLHIIYPSLALVGFLACITIKAVLMCVYVCVEA